MAGKYKRRGSPTNQLLRTLRQRTAHYHLRTGKTAIQERMASVMSAILLTAAIVGLGYSCESQAQSPAAHRVCSRQFMPQLQVLHTMVHHIHHVVRCIATVCRSSSWYVRIRSCSSNMAANNQTDRKTFRLPTSWHRFDCVLLGHCLICWSLLYLIHIHYVCMC